MTSDYHSSVSTILERTGLLVITVIIISSLVIDDARCYPVAPKEKRSGYEVINGAFSRLKRNHHQLRRHVRHRDKSHILEALKYLRQYGYLKKTEKLNGEKLTKSLIAFQKLAGLKETGKIDWPTLEMMRKPRCGNEDTVSEDRRKTRIQKRFIQMGRWPQRKLDNDDTLHLRWYVQKYTNDMPEDKIRKIIKQAFNVWSTQVAIPAQRILNLEFSEAISDAESDISIAWALGEHGDDYPFDGAGNNSNVLAHTFYPNYKEGSPLNGDIHFDDHEKWTIDDISAKGAVGSKVRFPYVLAHEIGHSLGLGHSMRQEAIMNPMYRQTALDSIHLDIDDKCAINWNYIGPSPYCMFIWLMAEYLPLVNDGNETHVSAPAARKIPRCTPNSSRQSQFADLLSKKLSFPYETAQRYGKVVCNYMDGLYDVLRKRQGNRPNNDQGVEISSADEEEFLASLEDRRDLNVEQMKIHSYPSLYNNIQTTEDFERRLNDRRPSSITFENYNNSSDLTENLKILFESIDGPVGEDISLGNKLTFPKSHFSEQFFRNLIKIFLLK
uniref:Peptidase metallopeptidase domain-containing protein n=1 Tax=Romanomermis culicivorax TaxID=13658 RepID=A0A915JYU2_ROMCU